MTPAALALAELQLKGYPSGGHPVRENIVLVRTIQESLERIRNSGPKSCDIIDANT